MIEANWPLAAAAVVVLLLLVWWLIAANRKTSVQAEDRPEQEPVAKRNQALIDAPPASRIEPVSSPPAARPAVAETVAPAQAAAKPAAPQAVTPAPAATAVEELSPASAPASSGGDLARIKGIGPKLVVLLQSLGVTDISQIAAWDDADINKIDARLGRFQGRIRRDNWVEQARLLAADDMTAYEGKFGKL